METRLKKKKKTDLTEPNQKDTDIINPPSFFSPFMSFSYSYRSVYSDGERTHIKANAHRFENGQFESETFEGTTDQRVYDQMLKGMCDYINQQMNFFLNPFSFFLPNLEKDDD